MTTSKHPRFHFLDVKFILDHRTYQIVLSTAHPAKFSEAVTKALEKETGFNFERDVLPEQFRDLLTRPRRVINLATANIEEVKATIESKVPTEKSTKTASV